jgi:hypothetical protein
MSHLLFPGLWRWMFWSAWNRYRRSSRFRTLVSGPHGHVGKRDYFSFKPIAGEDGSSYADASFDVLTSRLSEILGPR